MQNRCGGISAGNRGATGATPCQGSRHERGFGTPSPRHSVPGPQDGRGLPRQQATAAGDAHQAYTHGPPHGHTPHGEGCPSYPRRPVVFVPYAVPEGSVCGIIKRNRGGSLPTSHAGHQERSPRTEPYTAPSRPFFRRILPAPYGNGITAVPSGTTEGRQPEKGSGQGSPHSPTRCGGRVLHIDNPETGCHCLVLPPRRNDTPSPKWENGKMGKRCGGQVLDAPAALGPPPYRPTATKQGVPRTRHPSTAMCVPPSLRSAGITHSARREEPPPHAATYAVRRFLQNHGRKTRRGGRVRADKAACGRHRHNQPPHLSSIRPRGTTGRRDRYAVTAADRPPRRGNAPPHKDIRSLMPPPSRAGHRRVGEKSPHLLPQPLPPWCATRP